MCLIIQKPIRSFSLVLHVLVYLDALDLNIKLSIALVRAKELEEALICRVHLLAISLYFYIRTLF